MNPHKPYKKNLHRVRQEAESGIVDQIKHNLHTIKSFLAEGVYNQATLLCNKSINKLATISNTNELTQLKQELELCKTEAKNQAKEAAYNLSATDNITSAPYSTMFSAKKPGPSKKELKTVTAEEDKHAKTKPIVIDLPVPTNNNPHEKKIGNRVTAPFIKQGTSTLFPVLMKNIPEFNALKITNRILYRELKRAVLEGGICQKVGQSGIKYLGDGKWEAKVNSRSRLLGRTVEGEDGFKYIVFTEFTAKGLHRSK